MTTVHPLVTLLQRMTLDWLDRADAAVPPQIMTPDYAIHIGGVHMHELAAYIEVTKVQLARFPGLLLTVHDVLTDGDRIAMAFTEHGASARHDLARASAWRGVALFRWDGERFTENWTEEDYYGRRRQLNDGVADPVPAPTIAPWTSAVQPASAAAETAARAWLETPQYDVVQIDDGRSSRPVLEVAGVEVGELFSAGDKVACTATWTGRYLGGLADVPDVAAGADVTLGIAAVLQTDGDRVVGGSVVTDRLGLRRRMLA